MEKKYFLSASLVCADMLHLGDQVKKLEAANIDYIHIDVMDGHFVPRFGLMPEIVKQVRDITSIPMDVHLMTNNPEPYIKSFAEAGVQIIAVHVEDNPNLHRTIKLIKDTGVKAGVVLNMATPLNVLDYILDDISMVMLMGINPGIVGHKIIPKVYDKIADLKEKVKDYPDMLIEIDGGVTPETLPEMIKHGANMFVCGTGTIFRPADMVKEKTIELRKIIDNSLKNNKYMNYKLLITTSGTGSRLGELTQNTNKALIQIGGKEIIAHIIDSYPEDIEIVITLGYYGEKVKTFLMNQYPNRKITYVYVDKFEGPGSSLGYSMLQAKKELNSPFIFHCNDTIVNTYIPDVKYNWAGGYKVSDSTQYTTFNVDKQNITSYNTNKGATLFDLAHLGIAGIYEHEKFFSILETLYEENPNNSSLNDVYVLDQMLQSGSEIQYIEFSQWLDTGNIQSLNISKEKIKTL